MDIVDFINEARTEMGRGSKEGRSKYAGGGRVTHSKSEDRAKSEKGRVKIYDSIMDALRRGYYGQIFSTIGSDRTYVITRRKWGHDDEQAVGDKVAKGFSPGSIPSSFREIKGYAIRTMLKHGNKAPDERLGRREKELKNDT